MPYFQWFCSAIHLTIFHFFLFRMAFNSVFSPCFSVVIFKLSLYLTATSAVTELTTIFHNSIRRLRILWLAFGDLYIRGHWTLNKLSILFFSVLCRIRSQKSMDYYFWSREMSPSNKELIYNWFCVFCRSTFSIVTVFVLSFAMLIVIIHLVFDFYQRFSCCGHLIFGELLCSVCFLKILSFILLCAL